MVGQLESKRSAISPEVRGAARSSRRISRRVGSASARKTALRDCMISKIANYAGGVKNERGASALLVRDQLTVDGEARHAHPLRRGVLHEQIDVGVDERRVAQQVRHAVGAGV